MKGGMGGGRTTSDRVSTCTGLGTPEWKALCFATCRSRQVVETKDALRKTTFSEEVSYKKVRRKRISDPPFNERRPPPGEPWKCRVVR